MYTYMYGYDVNQDELVAFNPVMPGHQFQFIIHVDTNKFPWQFHHLYILNIELI